MVKLNCLTLFNLNFQKKWSIPLRESGTLGRYHKYILDHDVFSSWKKMFAPNGMVAAMSKLSLGSYEQAESVQRLWVTESLTSRPFQRILQSLFLTQNPIMQSSQGFLTSLVNHSSRSVDCYIPQHCRRVTSLK